MTVHIKAVENGAEILLGSNTINERKDYFDESSKSKHKDERGTVLAKYNNRCISCRLRVGEHNKKCSYSIIYNLRTGASE